MYNIDYNSYRSINSFNQRVRFLILHYTAENFADSIKSLAGYPDITPTHVIGHSDIAPQRKSDPGAAFPWKELYKAGIGAWFDTKTKLNYLIQFTKQGIPDNATILKQLNRYGYDITGADADAEQFNKLIRAFQLHFRPTDYSGRVDCETVAILYALIEKYFPEA